MKKKSLITMLVALSLTASVMVGATLAYLTAETGEKVNTFTIGNVKIELEEPGWDNGGKEDAENLEPGATIAKDPTVTNTGINDAYIAVTVSGMDEMASVGFDADVNEGWVKVNADGTVDTTWDESTLVDGIYAYTAVLPSVDNPDTADVNEKETPALFSNVTYNGLSSTTTYTVVGVEVDESDETKGAYYVIKDADGNILVDGDAELQFATAEEAKNYIDSNVDNLTDVEDMSFDLVVKAYAIQTTGFEDAADYAWVAEIDF